MLVDEHPVYLRLSEDETERKIRYREFVRGMLKEKEAMSGEMDRRIVYGGERFVREIMATHKIPEKVKQNGETKRVEEK